MPVFADLRAEGVTTYCTTVFSLPQAAGVAQAGANHILPFCEPVKQMGGDPTKLVRECVQMFSGWEQRPFITAALIRSVDVAHAALRDGADGIIIFWTVFKEMMEHALTDIWKPSSANARQGKRAGAPRCGAARSHEASPSGSNGPAS